MASLKCSIYLSFIETAVSDMVLISFRQASYLDSQLGTFKKTSSQKQAREVTIFFR